MASFLKNLILYVTIICIFDVCLGTYGTNYFYGHGQNFLSSYPRYGFTSINRLKQISASVPTSPVFDVEIVKPMAQLEEKTKVPLYVIPQSSLHVYPNIQRFHYENNGLVGSPSHLPAIEIPLAEPLVLGSTESTVLAPKGFTILREGVYEPLITTALLAPVPLGTIVSPQTPVIISVLYAIPHLPLTPSHTKILAHFPQNLIGGKSEKKGTEEIAEINMGMKLRPAGDTYLPPTTSSPITIKPDEPEPIREEENKTNGPEQKVPFINSKESPYLQELREESLLRQIQELTQELNELRRIRNFRN